MPNVWTRLFSTNVFCSWFSKNSGMQYYDTNSIREKVEIWNQAYVLYAHRLYARVYARVYARLPERNTTLQYRLKNDV